LGILIKNIEIMKYIKLYESFNKQIAVSEEDTDGWKVITFDSKESFDYMLSNFYLDKKWIHKEGNWDIYYYKHTDWDKNENEPYWYTKKAIYIDYINYIIKVKEIEDKPMYAIRDEKNGMTRKQESTLRSFIGTEKNPKIDKCKGEYLGMDGEYALMKSSLSCIIYKIDKDGELIKLNEQ
jgi:hypothetical protein